MYSEYKRTSGVDTGITAASRSLARAPLALSGRATMRISRLRLTKSPCRRPSACPTRIPVSASSANKNRSRSRSQAARIAATCPASRVRGTRRVTISLTGLTGIGRPLVTWCRNGL